MADSGVFKLTWKVCSSITFHKLKKNMKGKADNRSTYDSVTGIILRQFFYRRLLMRTHINSPRRFLAKLSRINSITKATHITTLS